MFYFAVGISMAIICSVAGDFLVKSSTAEINGPNLDSFGGVWHLFNPFTLFQFLKQYGIFHNWKLLLGIVLLTFHFGGFLLAMRVAPVTLVAPMMSSTYIIDTLLGKFVLHERVTWLRWTGVMVVVSGIIILIGFSKAAPA